MKTVFHSMLMAAMMMYLQPVPAQDLELLPETDAAVEAQASEEAEKDLMTDPDVKVRQAGNKTVKEYQEKGRTYKVEVIPDNAPAYILSDQDGSGEMNSSDTSLDTDVVVPEWKIGSW